MKHRDRILAGTAIGILMAASSVSAHAMQAPAATTKVEQPAPVILAQASNDDQDQKQRRKERGSKEGKGGGPRAEQGGKAGAADQKAQPRTRQEAAPQAKPERKAAPESRKDGEKAATPQPRAAEKPEPKAQGKPAPKAAEKPEKRAPKAADQAEQPKAKPVPKADNQAKQPKAKPAPKAVEQGEQPSAKPKAVEREQPGKDKASPSERKQERRGADKRERGDKDHRAERDREKNGGKAANPAQPEAAGKAGNQTKPAAKSDEAKQQDRRQADEKKNHDRERGNEASGKDGQRAGERERQRSDEARTGERDRQNQNAAPMLDSQKNNAQHRKGEARHERGDNDRDARRNRDDRGHNAERDRDRDDRGRARAERRPDSDRAAQRDINVSIKDLRRLDDEKGRRIDRSAFGDFRRRDGAEVVKKMGDRTLIQFNNRIIVEDHSHDRIRRHARDVYYEELPNQLRREVVVRPDGSQIITVRNGYGDIVGRTRIVNGQRYVLLYAGDDSHDGRWRDPAADLPPLQIDIPRSEYILESDNVSDSGSYYDFLEQPPVVPVERLYSIDQVKYSARVRDMVRRVDLDTINFATGSAEISQNELPALEALADAMQRMIDDNPAETFLIEGHTDAVGSDESNLVLSDERAESVASALTDVYDIPPENLFTQGYGEQYLKIDTEGAERENRRVAIRRITALVSPVASAEQ